MSGLGVRSILAAAVLGIIGPASARSADLDDGRVLVVEAGEHPRTATVITVSGSLPSGGLYSVVDRQGHRTPLQRISDEAVVFRLASPLQAGATAEFRVVRATSAVPDSQPDMYCRRELGALSIASHGREVLRYRTAVVDPPAGIDHVYRRSGHIHPLRTPSGRVVTEEFPADHPHQHGIFSAWVNTTFEGRSVDFWNQKAATGTVQHVSVNEILSGPCVARFAVTQHQVDVTDPSHATPVVADRWIVSAYDQPPMDTDYFLFDIDSLQTGIAESALSVLEYHYGGMAFRGAAEWFGQPEHDFLTSEGLTRADGNHSRPRWVCAHGIVEGAPCSIAIMGHPDNFRAPQPVRLHPDKPYFVFTPPVLGAFEIGPESKIRSVYRCIVHDGAPRPDLYERLWRDFSVPPTVRIRAVR